ncbi:MAG: hypothetical protein RM368_05585 [Nostoc sp. DedSLP03]|uniref:hypothetical protein n=1 Tax=Nostoc sp. DedSLP03 TaxID=3075400 RepID=UPI002AD26036|nr:hypothetical protein [Nostoc sp. DedSLP03]MDZ7964431.1 hypothetical protein [Nostoc sp. DedSLP03]
MIISDLNYLENTSEEIIGGGNGKVIVIVIKPKPTPKYTNFAQAIADASATGGVNNSAFTQTNATTTKNSATASSISQASTKSS